MEASDEQNQEYLQLRLYIQGQITCCGLLEGSLCIRDNLRYNSTISLIFAA